MIQLIRGFKDILPEEMELWQQIENSAVSLFEDFDFREIRVPMMERTELFARSIGEDTDIVEKEMYTFSDRKKELLTLRPEATASIVRSYIQHKLYAKDPVRKFYTIGPMFRRERPQKGRYRQFYQINAEVFGIASALIDAQLIFMLTTLFERLSVTDVQSHINSLGCPLCRPNFKTALSEFLSSTADKLCPDCTRRHQRNPLRVLDCKVPSCKEALVGTPSMLDFLCPRCEQQFEILKDALDRLAVPYVIDNRLVRGLDYYNRATFEIKTGLLGAQDAVAGGGRYDGLVKALGGPDLPATGFAVGLDRLAELVAMNKPQNPRQLDVFVAPLGEKCKQKAFEWTCSLGLAGIKVEMEMGDKSLKSQMKRANKLLAGHVLIVGDKELEQGSVILRNMETKSQTSIPIETLVENVKSQLKG